MKFLKKLGREVLFLKSTETNQRNGEGDFIRLKDGTIMHAYSAFIDNSFNDYSKSYIRAIYSKDEGETWSEPQDLITLGDGDLNLMCVSFLRMKNGDLGIIYGRKYKLNGSDLICTNTLLRRSTDEGKTWSSPVQCHNLTEYVCYENGRVIMTKTGRIIVPLNLHKHKSGGVEGFEGGKALFFASDDDGKTFHQIGKFYSLPFECSRGLQENGVIELESGRLFSYNRTAYGCQYESFSNDDGETWTEPKPSITFYSPLAPMNTKHLGDKYTIAVHCPYPGRLDRLYARSPLICNIVKGGGEDFWKKFLCKFYLEEDLEKYYCYPSIFSGEDYFLVAYYIGQIYPDKYIGFGDMKIIKVKYSEFEEILEKQYSI
ncbi:MAG: exo-alpha-sialidase [Clostridia bacterium]|nr:exo-alpha-sialidase [Clostridia bacterium]